MELPEMATLVVLLYIGLMIFMAVTGLALLAFWVWMLIDCLQNEPSEGNDKVTWTLVIILANWVGALLYFAIRRPQRKRQQQAAPAMS